MMALFIYIYPVQLYTYRQRSRDYGIFNCSSIDDCKIVFCSWQYVMIFLFSRALRVALRLPSPYFYVWEWNEWGHETNHWPPSSVLEVNNEWSCKLSSRIISCRAQVKICFTFRDAMPILRIENNSNVKGCLISLRTYLCSYYILCFMYVSKENKLHHDTIRCVA